MSNDLEGRLGRERGIGRVLAKRLIGKFGPDLKAMTVASDEELLNVKGLGQSRLSGVREALQLLLELSGPVVPAAAAQATTVPLPAVELQSEDGEALRVALPALTLQADRDGVRVEGFGLDLVVALGQPLELTGTWDGESLAGDGTPAINWSLPEHQMS